MFPLFHLQKMRSQAPQPLHVPRQMCRPQEPAFLPPIHPLRLARRMPNKLRSPRLLHGRIRASANFREDIYHHNASIRFDGWHD